MHVSLHWTTKFHANCVIDGGDIQSYRFYRMAAIASQIWFGDLSHLRRSKSISTSNFDQISQSTADILLFPVHENKRPPYWNSTSGFDFELFTVIGMWFSISAPHFIGMGHPRPTAPSFTTKRFHVICRQSSISGRQSSSSRSQLGPLRHYWSQQGLISSSYVNIRPVPIC